MKYNLTEKLDFNADPVIVINDQELTVNSDAESVLKIMDVIETKGEMQGALECLNILFGEEDMDKIKKMKLKMPDFMKLIQVAADLAMGSDPDEELGEQ